MNIIERERDGWKGKQLEKECQQASWTFSKITHSFIHSTQTHSFVCHSLVINWHTYLRAFYCTWMWDINYQLICVSHLVIHLKAANDTFIWNFPSSETKLWASHSLCKKPQQHMHIKNVKQALRHTRAEMKKFFINLGRRFVTFFARCTNINYIKIPRSRDSASSTFFFSFFVFSRTKKS